MATAQLIGSYADVAQGVTAEGAEGDLHVRLEVHDASRLEWSIAVPFPDTASLTYGIEVEMELPSNTFGRHEPWEQMQSFTRLDGGALLVFDADVITIDSLRRGAVALANKMARASEGFARHCLVSASLFTRVANHDLEQTLTIWLDGALAMAEEARR